MRMNEHLSDQTFDVRDFVEVDKATLSIAAVLYDVANGREIASFNQLVGGSEGEDFPEALGALKAFCGAYPVWTFDKGQEILERNCKYFAIPFPFRVPFIRVKSLLRGWKVDPRGYTGGTLHQAAGLKMDSAPGGLHNVRSLAAAVSYFENRDLIR